MNLLEKMVIIFSLVLISPQVVADSKPVESEFGVADLRQLREKLYKCEKSESPKCFEEIFEIPLVVHAELFIDSYKEKTPKCKMKDDRYLSTVEEMKNCFKHPDLQEVLRDCLNSANEEDLKIGHAQNKSGVCYISRKGGKWIIDGIGSVPD